MACPNSLVALPLQVDNLKPLNFQLWTDIRVSESLRFSVMKLKTLPPIVVCVLFEFIFELLECSVEVEFFMRGCSNGFVFFFLSLIFPNGHLPGRHKICVSDDCAIGAGNPPVLKPAIAISRSNSAKTTAHKTTYIN